MDCSTLMRKYSRYLLVIFNFVFVLTGILILSVGFTVKAYYNEYGTLLENKYFYASDFLIAIGVTIFIIAFFGCCGALKENSCMTLTFSTLLIVIFILEALAGIGGFLLKNKAESMIGTALNKSMEDYGKVNETTYVWDTIQMKFNCCGIFNYTDWEHNVYTNGSLPYSCCIMPHGGFGNFSCNKHTAKETGCLTEFTGFVEDHAVSIESVGIGLAIIQLLGILLSCYLSKQIRNDYETV